MRQTVVDRLLTLLEAYAIGRADEKAARKARVALICERRAVREGNCWLYDTPGQRCAPCEERDAFYAAFRARRTENRRLLHRIEALALQLSLPGEVPEPEPQGPLLEMMGVNDGTA